MNKINNYGWGFVLILLGVILGLNAIGITSINLFFKGWWTLFIIIPSFISLFKDKDKTSSIILLLVGIFLLLSCLDILDFSILWKLLLPIILIIIGLSIIFKDLKNSKIKKEIEKLNKQNNNEYYVIFKGKNLDFSHEDFSLGIFNVIFGALKCDLRKTNIKSDIVINANAIFGGIDIYVPDDVCVKVNSTSIFGGVDSKKNDNNQNYKYTIYINAMSLFGGIEIK